MKVTWPWYDNVMSHDNCHDAQTATILDIFKKFFKTLVKNFQKLLKSIQKQENSAKRP